ncbi:YHYH protein [Maribacter sp. 6B07]|uniref:YHYH protein n=1 Tax=Maribacter sp. 6B07 TaxID=2045442 RepID=UPI000C08D370|nr:YHYH protein [Maribacter sp. 6B07]PHN92246.1 YHYH protein [Maribacter sp. 6B07]
MRKNNIKQIPSISFALALAFITFVACSSDSVDDGVIDDSTTDDSDVDDDEVVTELHAAYSAFNSDAVTVYLDGSEVVIETTGLPNHETVYWGEGNSLYKEEPDVALTPSIMSSNNNAYTIRVDATPDLTGSTVQTELGTVGIAVSGSSIFNDQEGGGALDQAAASLDWTGAHIGPGVYHYHLEPKAFTNDDDNLVGILLDGVFLYGRKCSATGDYPTDLDASGGHTSTTQYTDGEEEYHYHIINEVYSTTGSYLAFAGPYQGY